MLLGFIFGLGIGNEYSDSKILVVIFIIGFIVMYLTHPPGEM